MTARARTIKLDSDTADRLEAWARERGLTVAELLAELAAGQSVPLPEWDSMRNAGRGPWAPEVLAEDARRLERFERTGEGVPWGEVESWIRAGAPQKSCPLPSLASSEAVKLVVSKEALADIERLRAFLDEKEAGAARHAIAALQKAVGSLEIFPGRGRQSGIPGLRELVVPFGRSAYVVRYLS